MTKEVGLYPMKKVVLSERRGRDVNSQKSRLTYEIKYSLWYAL